MVPEPIQSKIKLKVGQATETPSSSKKITIHVGGRGGSGDSPAPQTAQPAAAAAVPSVNGNININGNGTAPSQVIRNGQTPAAVASPSPSVHVGLKTEDSARISPAISVITPGATTPAPVVARPPIPVIPSQPLQNNMLANGYVEQRRMRATGKGV